VQPPTLACVSGQDFLEMLPMPEYTHTQGPLNLVSYLKDNSVKPDLGPKSYVAFGRYILSITTHFLLLPPREYLLHDTCICSQLEAVSCCITSLARDRSGRHASQTQGHRCCQLCTSTRTTQSCREPWPRPA
jgi:hypothetical protein